MRNGLANRLNPSDRAFHEWYRFVLSYPPHLVSGYLDDFELPPASTVLDPFCGTGTTLVESKLRGMHAVGLEANPFAHFASSVKIDWEVDSGALLTAAEEIAAEVRQNLLAEGIDDSLPCERSPSGVALRELPPEAAKLLITGSISPIPLHKTLTLLESLNRRSGEPYHRQAQLALAKALVFSISNLHFGPEVGVGKPKTDAPVIPPWLTEVKRIAADLRSIRGRKHEPCQAFLADARDIASVIAPQSVDAVITSPPYPNEKDYTRMTRLESVVLGFIKNMSELRRNKKNLVRSNTRSVYREDHDDSYVAEHPEIQRIAEAIEKRRIELGKTSGFERMYGRVTQLYFGGMARHFAEQRSVLRPGARLAYVVGDQASYLRVMIRTGELLADIAQGLGYELVRIDLFRTRFATATREQLREEVVVLRWPGRNQNG
ncbi:MAG TPA: DNA methyltransferase [Planctomycetota bacterium]|nr:DNA methyltransferase [Planctomycetota bacterium]